MPKLAIRSGAGGTVATRFDVGRGYLVGLVVGFRVLGDLSYFRVVLPILLEDEFELSLPVSDVLQNISNMFRRKI